MISEERLSAAECRSGKTVFVDEIRRLRARIAGVHRWQAGIRQRPPCWLFKYGRWIFNSAVEKLENGDKVPVACPDCVEHYKHLRGKMSS